MPKNQEPKIRLNLDLTPRAKELLEGLQSRTDAASLVEVVRRSLSLFDIAVAHAAKGGAFILRDANGNEKELEILLK